MKVFHMQGLNRFQCSQFRAIYQNNISYKSIKQNNRKPQKQTNCQGLIQKVAFNPRVDKYLSFSVQSSSSVEGGQSRLQQELNELQKEKEESIAKAQSNYDKAERLQKVVDDLQLSAEQLLQQSSEESARSILKEKAKVESQVRSLREKKDNYKMLASKLGQMMDRLKQEDQKRIYDQQQRSQSSTYPKTFQQDDSYRGPASLQSRYTSPSAPDSSISRQSSQYQSSVYSSEDRQDKLQPIGAEVTDLTQSQQSYRSIWWDMGIKQINDSKSSLYALLNQYKALNYKEQAFNMLNLLNMKADQVVSQQLNFANIVALISLLADQFQMNSLGGGNTTFGSTFLKFLPPVTIQTLYKNATYNCIKLLDRNTKNKDPTTQGVTLQMTINSIPSVLVTLAKFVDLPRDKAEQIVTQEVILPLKDQVLQAIVMLRSEIQGEELSRQVDPVLANVLQLISVVDPNINSDSFKLASKAVQPIVSQSSRQYVYRFLRERNAQPHVMEVMRELLEGDA